GSGSADARSLQPAGHLLRLDSPVAQAFTVLAGMTMENGQLLDLVIELPAAGGRMIARHEGAVLLVAGGIPGERVEARVTRVEKRVAFAEVLRVLEPSPDRRESPGDPACGGCVYAEIAYPRQLELKAAIIR